MTRSERLSGLLDQLTIAEKADLITGGGVWTSRPVERLGIPAITVTDGPSGARGGGLLGTGTKTACIPSGSALGATWDVELVHEVGALLGDESRAKGAQVLLAPTINLHRNPLGGRNFECYSEDPLLSGHVAAAFVRGVQSRGVATTPKHFAGNDSEFERNTIDVVADERTLREVYLLPFEHAVVHGEAWGMMSSYNRLNGTFASEHAWLLKKVLRDDWGFDGFVVSDWFATRSTGDSIRAGLSWEMPGPGRCYGPENVQAALDAGEIDEDQLDALVADMLRAIERTAGFDAVADAEEKPLDRPEDRALIRRAASAGTVMITNDGTLPLHPSTISSLAVIGPNARKARIGGGGSATVNPYRSTSPLDAITDRLGGSIDIKWAQGADIDRSLPPLDGSLLDAPLSMEVFAGQHDAGEFPAEADHHTWSPTSGLLFFGPPAPGISADEFSVRLSGSFTPEMDGVHRLGLTQSGRTRVTIGGNVVIDAMTGDYDRGDSYFGMGSVEIPGEVQLTAGQSTSIEIEYSNRDAVLLAGASLGLVSLAERDLVTEAEQLAATTDVAIVVVGTNDDWETEGRDRDFFDLPGEQPDLIRRVAAVNPRTIVVVNTGGPHGMDWLDAPAAVLSMGFAGQEMGDSLVDILVGDTDPGGRAPTTIPVRYEHSPAYLNYPGENSEVRYGEGLFVGHRFFDARYIEPAVAFGHGLSYANFEWAPGSVAPASTTDMPEPITVEVEVTNTSTRDGVEVVQAYIEPPKSLLHRPVRELKGFAKLTIAAGATATARIEFDARSFGYFDPGDQIFDSLGDAGPVPAGTSVRRTEPGWYVEPGQYKIVLARSAVDHVETLTIELNGDEHRIAL